MKNEKKYDKALCSHPQGPYLCRSIINLMLPFTSCLKLMSKENNDLGDARSCG